MPLRIQSGVRHQEEKKREQSTEHANLKIIKKKGKEMRNTRDVKGRLRKGLKERCVLLISINLIDTREVYYR